MTAAECNELASYLIIYAADMQVQYGEAVTKELMNAYEKWTIPLQNWNLTLSQLAIYFDGRLNNVAVMILP
ncbi:hypothetical protein ACFFL1_06345 [Samsonia erythrinae]|nr:hypothetical protein [Samsonia erythrinae]